MSTDTQEKWILYSTSDEDSNSELLALRIAHGDTIVSVTGSGCRTLSLLSQNPRTIISVDYSPGQNYLLQLKLAAIRALSYDRLLEFFGVDPCQNRWEIFESLRKQIPPEAADYFGRHRQAIEQGILFAGRHEQFYVKSVAPAMHLLFGRALKRIYRCTSIEEQRAIYKTRIDGKIWRWLIRKGFYERSLRKVFNDQNYRCEIDVPSASDYMLERLEHTFSHHLAKENHWISFMLNGKYPSRSCLPHFLLKESYDAIRRSTTELKVVTGALDSYLEGLPSGSVDKFALSDITSCIGRDEFKVLLSEVARTGKPGARVCYRNFLAKYPVSANTAMQRDDLLCAALDWSDLAFAYSFEVASIVGNRTPVREAVGAAQGVFS